MKTSRLLRMSREFLSNEKWKTGKRKKCLTEIQLKLKKKAKKLEEKLKQETEKSEINEIKKSLAIVTAQREKIIQVLKSLK